MSEDSKHLTHTVHGTLAPKEWKKFTSKHLTYTIHSTFPPEEWKRFTSMLTGPAICRLAHALFRIPRQPHRRSIRRIYRRRRVAGRSLTEIRPGAAVTSAVNTWPLVDWNRRISRAVKG